MWMSRELVEELEDKISAEKTLLDNLKSTFSSVIVGQEELRTGLITALLCDGHVLIEGVPGLAKTLAARTLSKCVKASFSRIQFTPDLLPTDLTGTQVFKPETNTFVARKGPVFAQFILADEINRAPAKVQSALLEAMQERQVTFGGETHLLPEPFFVMATQNPIEQEGTYPLPEAQLDRFMLKVVVKYPSRTDERQIIDRMAGEPPAPAVPVVHPDAILRARQVVNTIY
ncbi:MAG: AAA domain-containing protein, partial [Candidatus Aegiribacteria sp.]|nr:AAA domain-containing protein [Candidatus Aegiribacteria sp.]MBD3293999.1 AAA domain-containing protein [Candidatus Fermentibacteria bacterium]